MERLEFHDHFHGCDVYFWKSPLNYTMFILEPAQNDIGGNQERRAGPIWDFRCQNGLWSFKNTSALHVDFGKRGECSVITDLDQFLPAEGWDQLPPVEGWDQNTPPELVEYLQRVHNMVRGN